MVSPLKERPPDLVIGLSDPGMTPLLRAGLGGLAASLRAILLEEEPRARWPSPVSLAKATATVEPQRIRIEWGGGKPEDFLKKLFEASFRIDRAHGLIELPGAYAPRRWPAPEIKAAMQEGLKRTFLQHGKTTKKAAKARPVSLEVDGQQTPFNIQPYGWFAHQLGWKEVIAALRSGPVPLAGWAYPGAAQRHIAFGSTKCEYTAPQALSAFFAPVGCLSYSVARGGVLVIPEPSDLVHFAQVRELLTPRSLPAAYLTGVGDAVLAAELALRMDATARGRPAVAAAHGVTLQSTAWARQQKSRVATLSVGWLADDLLDLYATVANELPTRIRLTGKGDGVNEDGAGFFPARSALRAFLTDNIASGRHWFAGFATAATGGKNARFIHYYRERDNLGALYFEERKGLAAMLKHLEEAEQALVNSVHLALRNRFGAIASEAEGNTATMKNRFKGERERWRLAFAGAKTCEQIRAALADLWSRAGANKELQAHWKEVLPLLREGNWQAARDLALVGLASYQAAGDVYESNED